MLAPTPVIPPSPLDLGGLFGAALTIVKRRFGLLVGIAAISVLGSMAVILAGVAPLYYWIITNALSGTRSPMDSRSVPFFAIFGAAYLLALYVQVKAGGMLTIAAFETARGERPNLAGIWRQSSGYVRRILPFGLVVGLVFGIAIGLAGLVIFRATAAIYENQSALAGTILIALVGFLALFVIATYLQIKLLYWLPSAAIEKSAALAGVQRSWNLTRGVWWRTYGVVLLAGLALGLVTTPLYLLAQVARPATSGDVSGLTPLEIVSQSLPFFAVTALTQLIIQLITMPAMAALITIMFIDRVRQVDEGATAQPGRYFGGPPQSGGTHGYPGGAWQGQPPTGYPGSSQPAWGQTQSPAPQPWGQAPATHQQWGQPQAPQQTWGQPQSPQQAWGPAQPPQPSGQAPSPQTWGEQHTQQLAGQPTSAPSEPDASAAAPNPWAAAPEDAAQEPPSAPQSPGETGEKRS